MKSLLIILMSMSLLTIDKSNQDWITYISKDKTFKVKFPIQPVEQQMAAQYGNLGSLLIASKKQ
jgi:hypothetical protein